MHHEKGCLLLVSARAAFTADVFLFAVKKTQHVTINMIHCMAEFKKHNTRNDVQNKNI